MSGTAVSPDGAWRWNGTQWVPNVDARPPAPPESPARPPEAYPAPAPAPAGLGVVGILALVFIGVALAMLAVQVGTDTVHSFKYDFYYLDNPWFYKFWYEAAEFAAATAGLVLGVITAHRTKSVFGLIIAIVAGGGFMQAFLSMFYRVVVSHWGYGVDLFY